jgi:ribosome biogenesis GTPase
VVLDHTSPHDSPLPVSLRDLGWDEGWDALAAELEPDPTRARPARVTLQGRDLWRVHDGERERALGVRGRLRRDERALPVAGDWVLLAPDGDVIESVLPRRTALVRKVAGVRTDEQAVAANPDVVVVCTPAHSINPRRLERELTAVWESGATPVVALTKADLDDAPAETVAELGAVALGVEVLAVSSYDDVGIDDVRRLVPPGRTLAIIGPSGAGKSTLVNALVGEHLLATTEVRESDHRGVHTTTARHLVRVPGAGLVLDTPGMRELALWADEDALDATFADVDEVARECRFGDCAHESEPGCAVLAAAEDGRLDEDRLASWRKLQRELAYLARKQDVRLQVEERRRWARISQSMKGISRP